MFQLDVAPGASTWPALPGAARPSSGSSRRRPSIILFVQINNDMAAAPHGGTGGGGGVLGGIRWALWEAGLGSTVTLCVCGGGGVPGARRFGCDGASLVTEVTLRRGKDDTAAIRGERSCRASVPPAVLRCAAAPLVQFVYV